MMFLKTKVANSIASLHQHLKCYHVEGTLVHITSILVTDCISSREKEVMNMQAEQPNLRGSVSKCSPAEFYLILSGTELP